MHGADRCASYVVQARSVHLHVCEIPALELVQARLAETFFAVVVGVCLLAAMDSSGRGQARLFLSTTHDYVDSCFVGGLRGLVHDRLAIGVVDFLGSLTRRCPLASSLKRW